MFTVTGPYDTDAILHCSKSPITTLLTGNGNSAFLSVMVHLGMQASEFRARGPRK